MKDDERVSVYISHPVPWRYSFCHCFISGLVEPDLIANKLDIILLKPGARQDWAMNPNLNSAWKKYNFGISSTCFYIPSKQQHLGFHPKMAHWVNMICYDKAKVGWWLLYPHSNLWLISLSWCLKHPLHLDLGNIYWLKSQLHLHFLPGDEIFNS